MTLQQGTFSYSGDPSGSPGDEVRFLIQDTDRTDPQVSDEEIAYVISQHGNASTCAVVICNVLATRFAQRSVDSKSVGDLQIQYADQSAMYRALATHIEATAGTTSTVHPLPLMTGRTFSQKQAGRMDTDRVDTHIHVGEDDNPSNSDSRSRPPQFEEWWPLP